VSEPEPAPVAESWQPQTPDAAATPEAEAAAPEAEPVDAPASQPSADSESARQPEPAPASESAPEPWLPPAPQQPAAEPEPTVVDPRSEGEAPAEPIAPGPENAEVTAASPDEAELVARRSVDEGTPQQPASAPEPGMWTHSDRPVAATEAAPAEDLSAAPVERSEPAPEPVAEELPAEELPGAPVALPDVPESGVAGATPGADNSAEPQGQVVASSLPPAPPLAGFVPVAQPEPEATQAFPPTSGRSPLAAPPVEDAPGEDESIFRPYSGALSGRLAASAEQNDEERKLAAERSALREARTAALTSASTPEPVQGPVAPVVQDVVQIKRTTDGFWGSLGLFLMRLAMAAVFGVWGVQMLLDPATTQSLFAKTVLPYPILATIVPVASLLIAVSMVIGLATRYAAVGAALIAIGALVLVYWGNWSLLLPNDFGFYGERELLLAAAGLLMVFIGAGGWSLDASLRRARAADKAARASASA
jgi:uncharacterized membrane protein YphA (DoxX/SURF4 family)